MLNIQIPPSHLDSKLANLLTDPGTGLLANTLALEYVRVFGPGEPFECSGTVFQAIRFDTAGSRKSGH